MPKLQSRDLIELDPHALVGKGLHRECFVHPGDPGRCIKIVVSGSGNENRREQDYYAELASRGVSWEMLPKFYGLVETNLGEGAVFDLIRDYDGRISLTLSHYLSSPQLTSLHGSALREALQALKSYLLEHRIITMTLKPKNILFQMDSADTGKLVIVDNIGNSDFIPLVKYSQRLARWKIRRKWRRFEKSLRADFAANKSVAGLIG
jgi:serine/threonine protein kinase